MNAEQKAFYEYGRAVESLRGTIYETRETAMQEFKDPYRLLSTYDRKQLIAAMGLASEISAVRQKRAACRAFMVSNDCSKCIHRLNKSPDGKCGGCKWDISYKIVKSRWEPRKEGES